VILFIGLASVILGAKSIYYSRKKNTEKLKKYSGTKNPKFSFILGIIGVVIGLLFLFLGIISAYDGDK